MNFSQQKGFSVVEAVIASSIFALIVTSLLGVFMYVNNSAQFAGSKQRALAFAEEGLEAVRNIRDGDYMNLTDGMTGLQTTGNIWDFAGTDNVLDEFTREIDITETATNTKQVTSTVEWEEKGVLRDVALTTYLTYWQEEVTTGDEASCLDVDVSGVALSGNRRELQGVVLSNTCGTPIIVDMVTVEWGNSREINRVRFGSINAWLSNGTAGSPSGTQPSGTELDIVDQTILMVGTTETRYRFSGNMNGQVFTITYTMLDGSTKVITGITP